MVSLIVSAYCYGVVAMLDNVSIVRLLVSILQVEK